MREGGSEVEREGRGREVGGREGWKEGKRERKQGGGKGWRDKGESTGLRCMCMHEHEHVQSQKGGE